jgi:hypothetical protein
MPEVTVKRQCLPHYPMVLWAHMSAGLREWTSRSPRLPRNNRGGWRGARKIAMLSFDFRYAAKASEFADNIK